MPEPTNHPNHHGAPDPVGDVVAGDPPVPITVWPVPAPEPGETMSNPMGERLVHNLTHPADLIIDLTSGPQLPRAIIASRRRIHTYTAASLGRDLRPAALIVTGWPPQAADAGTPVEVFDWLRANLLPGGCLAVLLPHDGPIAPVDVVAAAKQAGLGYLQHIVATHRTGTRGKRAALSIHTDVLILTHTPDSGADG